MIWWIVSAVVVVFLVFVSPVTPRTLGRLAKRFVDELRVLSKAKRNRTDFLGFEIRRPALLAYNSAAEMAQLAMNSVNPRLKVLAAVKASSMAGCPF